MIKFDNVGEKNERTNLNAKNVAPIRIVLNRILPTEY